MMVVTENGLIGLVVLILLILLIIFFAKRV